jgi:5,10-methylenetetrahydromethanopterin reductase
VIYDTQLLCADFFVAAALAADRTSKIRIGPGVLVPTNRSRPCGERARVARGARAGRIDSAWAPASPRA